MNVVRVSIAICLICASAITASAGQLCSKNNAASEVAIPFVATPDYRAGYTFVDYFKAKKIPKNSTLNASCVEGSYTFYDIKLGSKLTHQLKLLSSDAADFESGFKAFKAGRPSSKPTSSNRPRPSAGPKQDNGGGADRPASPKVGGINVGDNHEVVSTTDTTEVTSNVTIRDNARLGNHPSASVRSEETELISNVSKKNP